MSGKILIIDGNSLINRAFFAVPGLTSKDGTPTNALHGFLTMLQRLMGELEPQYVTVAFDLKAPTFRHQSFAAYKGTRKGMPDELRVQMPLIKELLDLLGIHRLEWEGFEADDLIGTVARIGSEQAAEVFVATGDRDALQLVDDRIRIVYHGTKNNKIYDRAMVLEEYGIGPERIPDHKGLTGDVSDNIPGVPGIGKVTATKLLQRFQTVEALLEQLEDVEPARIRELIRENAESAVMSKRLATIETHVPLDLELREMAPKSPEREALMAFYRKYGMTSQLSKLQQKTEAPGSDPCRILESRSELEHWARKHAGSDSLVLYCLGDEGNVRRNRCRVLLLKSAGQGAVLVPGALLDSHPEVLAGVLGDSGCRVVGHNLKRDLLLLRNHGITLANPGFDVMIAAYLLEPQRKSQDPDALCLEYLDHALAGYDRIKPLRSGASLPLEAVPSEVPMDGAALLQTLEDLGAKMAQQLEEQGLETLFRDLEMPLVEVLAEMEYEGFQVNPEALREIGKDLDEKLQGLTAAIHQDAGEVFNINSPKQLGIILFEKLGLPAGKKTKTGYGTGQDILEKLRFEHPIIDRIIDYRTYSKLKSTYVDGLFAVINPDTGRIHSSLNQTVAVTGRLSSTEPNLQNIPVRLEEGRKIRKVFIPRDADHVLTDADYSQIELRVLAHMAQDPGMIQAFVEDQDIHVATAAKVFGLPPEQVTSEERRRAKEVNFGIVYGMSDYGLAENLGIPRKTAQKYIEQYFERYAGVKRFMDDTVRLCREQGYVQTLFHRRRFIPEISAPNFNLRAFGERTAMNTPIQGTAADIIKLAMVKVHQRLRQEGLQSKLILQVHDELIIDTLESEGPQVERLLREAMESAASLSVPLKVDLKTGQSWYETK